MNSDKTPWYKRIARKILKRLRYWRHQVSYPDTPTLCGVFMGSTVSRIIFYSFVFSLALLNGLWYFSFCVAFLLAVEFWLSHHMSNLFIRLLNSEFESLFKAGLYD